MPKIILIFGFGPGVSTAVAAFPADAADPAAIRAAITKARAALGPITVIHRNAFSGGEAGDFLTTDPAVVRGNCDVGLLAAVQEALADLQRPNEGAVLITNGAFGEIHPMMDMFAVNLNAAALVPRPRAHLTRYHRLLAPNRRLRARIVPSPRGSAARKRCQGRRPDAPLCRTHRRNDEDFPIAPMTWPERRVTNHRSVCSSDRSEIGIDITTCPDCGRRLRSDRAPVAQQSDCHRGDGDPHDSSACAITRAS